ncbi:MAG TPA: zinc ribbon domain-containing protein [Terriglobales bacterium]
MTKLVCPDCQHENEPERIYCHNCGARLERSALIREKAATDESGAQAREHLKKMFRPGRGQGKRAVVKFLKILLGAACLAVIIQLILPPDLPIQPNEIGFAPMINMDLGSALESHRPAQLSYNEEQVNSYLAASLRRSNSPAKEGFFPLARILVKFEEGVCGINIERQFFGLSIYSGSSYRVTVGDGKIASANIGGYIGRMPIHPALMKAADTLFFSKAWETLARERKDVTKLGGIEFHPQAVRLIIPP